MGLKNKDKLAFNIDKYIRQWGIEFVLNEIVYWMETHDQNDPKFNALTVLGAIESIRKRCSHKNAYRGKDISGCSEGKCYDCGYAW